ncbi:hypothetical protein [Microbacterium sp. 77mftsu3.1]|uniref:hypothetical protein n=1 Tax=Microbacterium sp. 77mftsu3.1 TaxID=1761802 RepID=UPI00037C1673|nr:hypothetical protein [Microbacterium sp. 77mftsu3.1]SDH35640.1 hypothetical protein SAMN04488590_3117 [Microbacterium sp. 77mftsu3.1]
MTSISAASEAVRESHRQKESGRFGKQEHTAPELGLPATVAAIEDLWETRKVLGDEVQATLVAGVAARLPDSVSGIRFRVIDGQLTAIRLMPSLAGVPTENTNQVLDDVRTIEALGQNRANCVDLRPIDGETDTWEWAPTAEQRALTADEAEALRAEASDRFHEADYDLHEVAAAYLQGNMPEWVDEVEIAALPGRPFTIDAAYDADGQHIPINRDDPAWVDYATVLRRAPGIGRYATALHETHRAPYVITRKA